ncbi:MAG: DUF4124 domain-containing protein [Thermodesulfobacteriota bacterium]|jgi:hypothetical protein
MKKLLFILFLFIFASSASATIYRWVDEKGVVSFTDDVSKVPPDYRNKVEKVDIPEKGASSSSQAPAGKASVSAQPAEAGTQAPPIAQTMIREGEFAVKLAESLKMGQPKSEAEAETMLTSVGIAPKNGWIADYPVTPDIIGELQNAIGSAVDSGKLGIKKEAAVKAFQDLSTQQGLPVKVNERQNPIELTPGEKRRIESGAIDAFEQIIFLCKRDRFDEIYEYGNTTSQEQISKEMFTSEWRHCPLALSWETVRDIPEVEIVSPTRVKLKATLGFRGPFFKTYFHTQIFEMTLEKGEWRIDLSYPLGIEEGQQYNEPKHFRHRPFIK